MKDFFGINAPWISWGAVVLVIIWPIIEIVRVYWLKIQIKKALIGAIESINGLSVKFPISGSGGRDARVIGELDKMFRDTPNLFFPWRSFKTKLIPREIIAENEELHDQDQVWSSCSAVSVFSEQLLFGKGFNKHRFTAIPGILTGIGLLFTFLAL